MAECKWMAAEIKINVCNAQQGTHFSTTSDTNYKSTFANVMFCFGSISREIMIGGPKELYFLSALP